MSEGFVNGGERVTKEIFVLNAGYSGQTSVAVSCGFSSKPGTVKIYGCLRSYPELYCWGIYDNVCTAPTGNTVTTFTVTDNLNGTVTIAGSQALGNLQVAIVKTLT